MTRHARAGRELRSAILASAAIIAGVFAAASQLAARVPPTPLDQKYLERNAALYAAARAYFPNDDGEAAPQRIFRLTRDQLDATVAALLPGYSAGSVKEVMARDPLQTNYEYAELLSITQANFGALAKWLGDIAAKVREKPAGVIDCPASNPKPDCLESKARAFVARAFRGDVEQAKLDRIVRFYRDGVAKAGFAQATGDLVEVALNSPSFLYRKDPGVDEVALAKLDAKERERIIAARVLQGMTYTLADLPPEGLGLDSSSAAGYVATPQGRDATIARVAASKQARTKLVRFFKAWLEVKEPADFTISPEVFPEFTPKLASAMVEETERFLGAQLTGAAPSLKSITQTTQSYIPKALEPIYALKSSAPPAAATPLDASQRLGIFSQPAVLASHSGPTNSRLVKRGVFWVRKVMCMEMETPSKEVLKEIENIYAPLVTTERARIETMTKPRECAGCHKLIDPFGFALESYDALGRWRTKDNGHAIDAAIKTDFLDEGAMTMAGPVEALRVFTGSLMFKQCFVRQMFRYYAGRNEERSDEPLLRRMFFEFADKDRQQILEPLQLMVTSDRVVQRD